jgi:DNA topoisomerase-3
VILQREVGPRRPCKKLLATGRTDLLKGFVSNKTRRKFSAYLVRDPKDRQGRFRVRAEGAQGRAPRPSRP